MNKSTQLPTPRKLCILTHVNTCATVLHRWGLVSILLFFVCNTVHADTLTWVGGTDDNLATVGNWNPATFGADMELVFGTGATATHTGIFDTRAWQGGTVKSLTMAGTISFSNPDGDAVQNLGTMTINEGANVSISSSKATSSAFFVPGGKVYINGGSLTLTGTSTTNAWHLGHSSIGTTGTLVEQTGGTVTFNGMARAVRDAVFNIKGGTTNFNEGIQLLNTAKYDISGSSNTTIKGTVRLENTSRFNISGGTVTFDNATIEAVGGNGGGRVIINGGNIIANGNIVKTGDAIMVANGVPADFTGTFEVRAGHLRVGNNTGLGGATVLLNGGILQNSGDDGGNKQAEVSNPIIVGENGGSLKAGWGGTTSESRLVLLGKITGSGLLKIDDDSGYVVVTNPQNDFSGGLEISGILRTNNDALSTGTITLKGGTLQNNGNGYNGTSYSPILTIDNPITVESGSIRSGWGGGTQGSITLNGKISGDGLLEIANDSGVIYLSSADGNDFTGGIKIGGGKNSHNSGQGIVILGADETLGTGLVSFGSNNSSLDLAGHSVSIRGLSDGSFTGTSVKNSGGEVATITLGVGTTADDSYTYSGALAENIYLKKVGAGTQIIKGDLRPEKISVAEGTLQTEGTMLISGAWEEFIRSATDYGRIVANSVTVDPTSLEFLPETADNLQLGADDRLSILEAESFTMSDGADPSSFDWSSLLSDNLRSLWDLNFVQTSNGGAVMFSANPNAVPEPTTWVILMLGIAGIFALRRKGNGN